MNRLLKEPLQFVPQLETVNKELRFLGYPEFWIDELFPLNLKDYNFENTPRVPFYWRQLSFILDELYLVHRDTGDIINITNLSKTTPRTALIKKNA